MFIESIAFTTVVSDTYRFAIFYLLRRQLNYSDYSFSFHPFLSLLLRKVQSYHAGRMEIFRNNLEACDRFRDIIATLLSDIDSTKLHKRQTTYMKNPFDIIRNNIREVQPAFRSDEVILHDQWFSNERTNRILFEITSMILKRQRVSDRRAIFRSRAIYE